ncbi:MAG TPA: DUF2336 domain-containing protein [Roseiarcus sp.]|nr:DUF2336 domain-containing protein [Roseiarcus sp.]
MFSTRNALVVARARLPSAARGPAIVRRFLVWAQQAGAGSRAEAVSALARAFLHSDLDKRSRAEAAAAMSALIDDPSPEVRRALAEAISGARDAPRHLVVALANDETRVAAPVLARSPLLTDAELVDCAAMGDVVAQCAIARRPGLGAGPAAALAEVGRREAALALIGNRAAKLTPGALRRLYARFGDDAEIREALLAHPRLPASLRAVIVLQTAKSLAVFVASAGWMDRKRAEKVARESRDAALATIAADCEPFERAELVRTLRERGALTMALILRSLLEGERELAAAALAELSGQTYARASAFACDPYGQGFAALALKSGIPRHALPALRAALRAIDTQGAGRGDGLKPRLVKATIASCEGERDPALAPILSLLWRFAAEAARTEARAMARAAAAEPHLPPALAFAPANDDGSAGEAPPVSIKALAAPVLSARAAEAEASARLQIPQGLIRALDAA